MSSSEGIGDAGADGGRERPPLSETACLGRPPPGPGAQRQVPLADEDFPALGETLADCKLMAELGRGVRGRVFLASQTQLADRLVVLKVSRENEGEQLSLARLLHTHIVPLHFVQEEPMRRLHVIAMPYLGGAPLSALFSRLRRQPRPEWSGRRLLEVLDAEQAGKSFQMPAALRAPIRAHLARLSYVEAICWLGACLADALQHAHERGVIHLDVKPANVLLAADAQPLLLDFHLARSPIAPGSSPPLSFGGTPQYMSPNKSR